MKLTRLHKHLLGSLFAAAALLGQAPETAQGTGGPAGVIPTAASPGEEVTSLPIVVAEPGGWFSLTGFPAELALVFRGLSRGPSSQLAVFQRGAELEIRLRGEVNLVLDRAALAASGVRMGIQAGPDFRDARAWVRYGAAPTLSLAEWDRGEVVLPRQFNDLPGRRPEFTFGAVNDEGAYYGVVAHTRGAQVLIAQRSGQAPGFGF